MSPEGQTVLPLIPDMFIIIRCMNYERNMVSTMVTGPRCGQADTWMALKGSKVETWSLAACRTTVQKLTQAFTECNFICPETDYLRKKSEFLLLLKHPTQIFCPVSLTTTNTMKVFVAPITLREIPSGPSRRVAAAGASSDARVRTPCSG